MSPEACARLRADRPDGETLRGQPPAQRKKAVEQYVGAILAAIEAEGGALAGWPARQLGLALGFMGNGWYSAAVAYADQALEPGAAPEGAAPTLADLKRALGAVIRAKAIDREPAQFD